LAAAPLPDTNSFSGWWSQTVKRVPKEFKKGLNSLIILVAWELWKHRNACVFDGARPCFQVVMQAVSNSSNLWCGAAASALHKLLLQLQSLSLDSNP
jgi:hypothetical protein